MREDTAFKLYPSHKMSIVGTFGMGALCYIPETYVGEKKTLPELGNLQQMALDVLSEKSDKDEDVLYFNSGNSGGCRPKCLLHDTDGSWLVKFRHIYDPKDMGVMEYHYNDNGEHATSVNNHGNPTIEDMLIVGESIRIPQKRGRELILNIAEGCSGLLSKDYILAQNTL